MSATARPMITVLPKSTTSDFIPPVDMEKRKNEIVQSMLKQIRPFMGAQGHLRPNANFEAFAALMAGETQYVQRTLLLTVLMSAGVTGEAFATFTAMASSAPLISVLSTWLGEAIKQESPLVGKLLELFHLLPLSVDQLVEHRLGKQVKRLVGNEHIKEDIRERAAALCDHWTRLARLEDAKRKVTGSSVVTVTTATASTKRSKAVVPAISSAASAANDVADLPPTSNSHAVHNMTLFNDHDEHESKAINNASGVSSAVTSNSSLPPSPPPPPLKTRAEQVLERLARGETATVGRSEASRPLSADDIRKAKKRAQYLQEAGAHGGVPVKRPVMDNGDQRRTSAVTSVLSPVPTPSTIVDVDGRPLESLPAHIVSAYTQEDANVEGGKTTTKGLDMDTDNKEKAMEQKGGRARKRVSFASDDKLVSVRYFEPPDADYYFHTDHCTLSSGRPSPTYHVPPLDANAHEMERNEASFAFQQMALVMEAEGEWAVPKPLSSTAATTTSVTCVSAEREAQEAREQRALSAVYFSLEDIPPSPAEPVAVETPPEQRPSFESAGLMPKKIPLKDVEGKVNMIVRYVERSRPNQTSMLSSSLSSPPVGSLPLPSLPPTLPASSSSLSSLPPAGGMDLLGSLLADPNALQNILKSVNAASSAAPMGAAARPSSSGAGTLHSSTISAAPQSRSAAPLPSTQGGGDGATARPSLPLPPTTSPSTLRPPPSLPPSTSSPFADMMPPMPGMPHPPMAANRPIMMPPAPFLFPPPPMRQAVGFPPHHHPPLPPHMRPPPGIFPPLPSHQMMMGMPMPPPGAFIPPQPAAPGTSTGACLPSSNRSLCKYYRKGRPGSCRNGSKCQFYHAEH